MNSTSMKTLFCALSLCVLISLASSSFASTINYGNFPGTDVTYLNVRESSISDPNVPLYGAPTVSGNLIDFDPTGFGASTTGGGIDFIDGQLNFEIAAHTGNIIDQFKLSERGDFSLGGGGTSLTSVEISTPITLTVTKVDNVPLGVPVSISTNMTFSPVGIGGVPGAKYDIINNAGTGQFWDGMVMIDVTQLLIDNSIPFVQGATEVEVDLDNAMTAVSEPTSSAFIAKKNFDSVTIVTFIPEPSTAALLLVGLLGGLSRRKRG